MFYEQLCLLYMLLAKMFQARVLYNIMQLNSLSYVNSAIYGNSGNVMLLSERCIC